MASSVPIIDLNLFESGTDEKRSEQVTTVQLACRKFGFFQLRNHGVPIEMQDAILNIAQRFFDLPQPVKDSLSIGFSPTSRGYSPVEHQKLDPEGFPDYKESFYITKDVPGSGNLYPPEQLCPDFRTITSTYHDLMIGLTQRVFRLLAVSLSLSQSYFDGYTGADGTTDGLMGNTLRLVHYPPRPQGMGTDHIGCGAHTDFGSITFLLQGDVSGLEIFPPNQQEWIPIPPKRDIFVVNVGDLLQKWTSNHYISALHRVSFCEDVARYSVPFFFNGNHEFIIQPFTNGPRLEEELAETVTPFTVGSHIRSRLRSTHTEVLSD